jgi:hypothetical protein
MNGVVRSTQALKATSRISHQDLRTTSRKEIIITTCLQATMIHSRKEKKKNVLKNSG